MSDEWEHLTDEELAGEVYVAIMLHDDELPDHINALYADAAHKAAALWARLRGPYCNHAGCGLEHMEHFPWCPWHRPTSYGPLPPEWPAYPGNAT